MKLNKSCVRKVLLCVEDKCTIKEIGHQMVIRPIGLNQLYDSDKLKNFDKETIWYTVIQLFMSQYITGHYSPQNDIMKLSFCSIDGLTPVGHALLDNIRDPEIWKKTKSKLSTAMDVSLDVLSKAAASVAAEYTKKMMGL